MIVGDETHSHVVVRSHSEDVATQAKNGDLFTIAMLICMIFVASVNSDKVAGGDVAIVEIQKIVVDEQRVENNLHAVSRVFGNEDDRILFVMVVPLPRFIGVSITVGEDEAIFVHFDGSVLHVDVGMEGLHSAVNNGSFTVFRISPHVIKGIGLNV